MATEKLYLVYVVTNKHKQSLLHILKVDPVQTQAISSEPVQFQVTA